VRIRSILYTIPAAVGLVGGMLTLSAGAASASVTGHEHGYSQPVQQRDYGQPVQQHGYQQRGLEPNGGGRCGDDVKCRVFVQPVTVRQPCKPRVHQVVFEQRKPCRPHPVVFEQPRKPCKPVVVVERKPCKPVVHKPVPVPVTVMVHKVKHHKAVCTNADVNAEKRLLERQQHHKLTKAQIRELKHLFAVCGSGRG
jgi:hypothetical protein